VQLIAVPKSLALNSAVCFRSC